MSNCVDAVCRDCGGVLQEIKVIDKGHYNQPMPLEYAAMDSKVSFWTGKLPVAGNIKTFLCAECGLIKYYGVPK